MPLPTEMITPEQSARSRAMLSRWERRQLAEHVDQIDQFYQHHDGSLAVKIVRRSLADHALESMEEFCGTVARMVADGVDDATIAEEAKRVVGDFVARHKEALDGL